MYRYGHAGAVLFLYAPLGAGLRVLGEPTLALAGGVLAVALSMLPDVDQFLPIDHRGPTHTVWFVAACGLLSALGGGLVSILAGGFLGRPLLVAAVAGSAATISLGSHLLADAITPMGIRPFHPLSDRHYTLDLTPAKNPRANVTLLGIGGGFALVCQLLVSL